jgi:hypothetical protein
MHSQQHHSPQQEACAKAHNSDLLPLHAAIWQQLPSKTVRRRRCANPLRGACRLLQTAFCMQHTL